MYVYLEILFRVEAATVLPHTHTHTCGILYRPGCFSWLHDIWSARKVNCSAEWIWRAVFDLRLVAPPNPGAVHWATSCYHTHCVDSQRPDIMLCVCRVAACMTSHTAVLFSVCRCDGPARLLSPVRVWGVAALQRHWLRLSSLLLVCIIFTFSQPNIKQGS